MKTIRSALCASVVALTCMFETGLAGAVKSQTTKPNIVIIWGDDIGQSNISAYSHGRDGLPDAEHRPRRQGRHDVHRLLRASRAAPPAGRRSSPASTACAPADQGRPAGRHARAAEGRPDDRRAAQAARLRHRPVRQEPPRRPQRVPADRPRVRRVLRQPLPPQRRGRAGTAGLPEGSRISARSTARAACWTARPPTRTTRRWTRGSARSASRSSRTPAR